MKKSRLMYIVLAAIMTWCAVFFQMATKFKISKYDSTIIKVNTFPMVLCVMVAGLCIACVVREFLKKDNEIISIPNLHYMILSVIITAVYLFVWQFAQSFYIPTFLYVFILLTIFLDKATITKKMLVWNAGISLSMCAFAYVMFEFLMGTKFVL